MSPSVEPFDGAKYKALMDGIQSAEIRLKDVRVNKDFRFDSNFYTIKTARNASLSYELIGKHLLSTQYGVSKDMNSSGEGYPIFRMNELHHGLCDIEPEKHVELSENDFEIVELHDGDVLFNRTNSYDLVGRTGIYYQHGLRQTYASYLVRLVPDNTELLSEYLVAFLNTKQGIQEIKRRARQSINQTNVNPEEVKRIQIPMVCMGLQQKIKAAFLKADMLRVQAQDQYEKAERIIDQTLGRIEYIETIPVVSEKYVSVSFASTGRLDAEYYQPKYDALFEALSCFNCKPLGGDKGIVRIKKSIEPGSEAYLEEGIPFVRVSDVNKYGIAKTEVFIDHNTVQNIESLYPKKDTILFSKDGSVGIAYKVENDSEFVTSGALLHLIVRNTKEVLPDYLTLVLNSPVVQLQAERDSNGAIIQHWKPSEIEQVVIPVLDMPTQEIIAAKVQESFALRRKSKELLEYAKQAVEMAIERGEDAALNWLNEKASL